MSTHIRALVPHQQTSHQIPSHPENFDFSMRNHFLPPPPLFRLLLTFLVNTPASRPSMVQREHWK